MSGSEETNAAEKRRRSSRWGRVDNGDVESSILSSHPSNGATDKNMVVEAVSVAPKDVPHDDNPAPSADMLNEVLRKLRDPSVVRRIELPCNDFGDLDVGGNVGPSSEQARRKGGVGVGLRLTPRHASALSSIPWKYHPSFGATGSARAVGGDGNDTGEEVSASTTTGSGITAPQQHPPPNAPTYSYLKLRVHQNTRYATSKLHRGIAYAKSRNGSKAAERCYKEGLDVCPHHAEILVAYGALCANDGRNDEAIRMFQEALVADPGHENARRYLDAILKRTGGRMEGQLSCSSMAVAGLKSHGECPARGGGVRPEDQRPRTGNHTMTAMGGRNARGGAMSRNEQAMRDALAERAFLSGFGGRGGATELGGYDLVGEDEEKEHPNPEKDESQEGVVGTRRGNEKDDRAEDSRGGKKQRKRDRYRDRKRRSRNEDEDERDYRRRKKRSESRRSHHRSSRRSSSSRHDRSRKRRRKDQHRQSRSRSPSSSSSRSSSRGGRKWHSKRKRSKSSENDRSSSDSSASGEDGMPFQEARVGESDGKGRRKGTSHSHRSSPHSLRSVDDRSLEKDGLSGSGEHPRGRKNSHRRGVGGNSASGRR